jgi:hypothetical protein
MTRLRADAVLRGVVRLGGTMTRLPADTMLRGVVELVPAM